jgi:hypothetical protein
MEKKSFVILSIFAVLLVFALSSVIALKMPRGWNLEAQNASNESLDKIYPMNYGKCVFNETKIKNDCYKQIKQTYKDCRFIIKNDTALNKTAFKEGFKICRENYKLELKQCKADFKLAKEDCKQYKRHFNNSTNSTEED